ncbi:MULTISPECIES: erythromycin esterase family protein [Prauserella salsuginis group]|uniref:Erythromycin esterase family protein n=1 Tax=Prauserella salsuginis TaxID=387889 RepID=A0ABW6FXB2_9PSEU|nr:MULTISPECIES: erythromycin esterase family protein [Prauserella salsuginis group]MCR3720186.1 erythromycin esterase [Prauserella flava]MCR3734105.1 erythromycin esterase [Prauserella salsuginis]
MTTDANDRDMSRPTERITGAAHPLDTTDPAAPLTDLEPLREVVGDASVVGLARGAHGAREFGRMTHRVLRLLVERLGFRSLAIEADARTAAAVDSWLRTGRGDVASLLSNDHSWWRTSEFLEVLHWMRAHNGHRPDDPVRLVGLVGVDAVDMSVHEQDFAATILRWRDETGHRILYWSGSHSAVGHARSVAWTPGEGGDADRNAGSYLREQLGAEYLSAGLTFHHGTVDLDGEPVRVPAPPSDFTDAVLGDAGLERYLLDLRAGGAATEHLADAPAKLRLIGPRYDPTRPASMSGGPLSEFFDVVLHTREVTPTTPAR